MKISSSQSLAVLFTLLLCSSIFPLDIAYAQRRGSGARRSNFRSGGASPRINTNVNLQNRGNIRSPSQNRSQFQQTRQERQVQRTERTDIRQGDRQGQRTERTDIRQSERTERTDIRQRETTERQRNRQDFVDDNYYGGRWSGGGWYGGGYRVPPGWGWVGFTTGLVVGAAVAQLPPYYSTVYVGSTTYIYSDGIFLQPSGSSYVVVKPPVGAVVTYLPEGCKKIQTNNTLYYNCSDIYYQPFYQNGSTVYKVVRF
ncbi:MAG: DUF6515 family protein [Prochloraceae cyanobacterium]|nr:DUF6515 family protein [Prochloraceae cyanobacterium]